MSYNFCGECGGRGHNRRTCPERLEAEKAWDRSRVRKTPRTCSYCGIRGHNRRSCEHLKARVAQAKAFAEGAVQRALSAYVERGLGVGALYEQTYRWHEDKATYIIDGTKACVSYSEGWYYDSNYSKVTKDPIPRFCFNLTATKVYGDKRPSDRSVVEEVTVYDNLQEGFIYTDKRKIIHFGSDDSLCTILGKTDNAFSRELHVSMLEWAHREVDDFYSRKDVQHNNFGSEELEQTPWIKF